MDPYRRISYSTETEAARAYDVAIEHVKNI
jgi:hypothetical protein